MGWIILLLALLVGGIAFSGARKLTVVTGSVALLYRRGVFERELAPGLHRWFDLNSTTSIVTVPTTKIVLPMHDVTVMTKDQFSFKIGLTPFCEIVEARVYHEAKPPEGSAWPPQFGLAFQELTPTIQSAAIACVSNLTLDEFLAMPDAVVPAVQEKLSSALPGTKLVNLLITSITMPPEIRKMFTEVERAKREGLASLERARSEQASLRALANAARTLRSNPQLAQLRMLQTIDNAKGNKTFILGSNDLNPVQPLLPE
jgi:regulator of protease activity HflC (stomatin/prohibitin superfamily)